MKRSVYVETSIFGYLAARPSRDVVSAARQSITQDWWTNNRSKYDLLISALVVREIMAGDPDAADRRRRLVTDIPLVEVSPEAVALAGTLVTQVPIPSTFAEDALHIAISAYHGATYLLTWNFKHINNARLKTRLAAVLYAAGFACPVICSPEEL
jgi:hypothetical protein